MAESRVFLVDNQLNLRKFIPHKLHASVCRGVIHHNDPDVFCRPAVQAFQTRLYIVYSVVIWYHNR